MELRHLRYFVAVAEEGSVTRAAERRLHTAQPSLSRQLRELEIEVGARLLERSSRGIELTAAGRAFLDHARLALGQVDAAREAARRAAHPARASFVMGFLTGQEVEWLAEAMRTLRGELPSVDVTVSSLTSPELAQALMQGRMDVAFMRIESDEDAPDLSYRPLIREPLYAVLPSDHRLAGQDRVDPGELAGETFINVSDTAPALRRVIDRYLREARLDLKTEYEADNLASAISLVASTRGVALLPAYSLHFLPWSVVSRPLTGPVPSIELVLGHVRTNTSPLLKLFLSRADDMVARVSKKLNS